MTQVQPSRPSHPGRLAPGVPQVHALPPGLPPLRSAVAQSPEGQQLQLWLPPLPPQQWTRLRVHDAGGAVLADHAMADLLQAGVRVLLDGLDWPPGDLWLRIGHVDGGELVLPLHKAADAQPAMWPQPAADLDDPAEQRLRRQAADVLQRQFGRALQYAWQGRGGTVRYVEPGCTLAFEVELGGDDEPLRIAVPSRQDWPRCTGLPVARRAGILRFVATGVQRDHTRSWRAEIRATAIVFVAQRPDGAGGGASSRDRRRPRP